MIPYSRKTSGQVKQGITQDKAPNQFNNTPLVLLILYCHTNKQCVLARHRPKLLSRQEGAPDAQQLNGHGARSPPVQLHTKMTHELTSNETYMPHGARATEYPVPKRMATVHLQPGCGRTAIDIWRYCLLSRANGACKGGHRHP